MKDWTALKCAELIDRYGKYGVSMFWLRDCLDEASENVSDFKALTVVEAMLVNAFEPEQLTEEQRELIRTGIARNSIEMT